MSARDERAQEITALLERLHAGNPRFVGPLTIRQDDDGWWEARNAQGMLVAFGTGQSLAMMRAQARGWRVAGAAPGGTPGAAPGGTPGAAPVWARRARV